MHNAITANGTNVSYQPAKVLSIPLTGIYAGWQNNDTSFLFALTYSRDGKTMLFDVRMPTSTVYVNEYHLTDDPTQYVYYLVTANSVDVYVNLMLNTCATVTCLSNCRNVNIEYFSSLNADTTDTLTAASIQGVGKSIIHSTIATSNITNLFAARYNVDSAGQAITVNVSAFLGNQNMNGYLKLVNLNNLGAPRTSEYTIVGSTLYPFNATGTALTVTVDTTAKTITVSNTAQGGLIVEYIPTYALT